MTERVDDPKKYVNSFTAWKALSFHHSKGFVYVIYFEGVPFWIAKWCAKYSLCSRILTLSLVRKMHLQAKGKLVSSEQVAKRFCRGSIWVVFISTYIASWERYIGKKFENIWNINDKDAVTKHENTDGVHVRNGDFKSLVFVRYGNLQKRNTFRSAKINIKRTKRGLKPWRSIHGQNGVQYLDSLHRRYYFKKTVNEYIVRQWILVTLHTIFVSKIYPL